VSTVRQEMIVPAGLLALVIMAAPGCSTRRLAVNALGNALAKGSSSWASDDDPELIRDATPFALKTIESLLTESPNHRGLLLAAASGFTQYAYAFVECEADYLESSDLARATAMRERAVKLYVRAQGYGWRGLEVAHPGLHARLRSDGASALTVCTKSDVAVLYWTAAPLAAAVSLAKQNAELAAELPTVESLMNRALALDEGFGDGAIHDFFIAYDGGRPPSAGGSPERARQHFERSITISGGRLAAPFVSYAESVLVGAQNRAEFLKLLERALAVDPRQAPAQQLANAVAQKRARWLLARVGDLFIE
jgi:predicted anti-sigma-YlaC factor YlaD